MLIGWVYIYIKNIGLFFHGKNLFLTPLVSYIYSHSKQLNGDLKGITFVMFAVHEQVSLMSSS